LDTIRVGDVHRPTRGGTPGVGDFCHDCVYFGLPKISDCDLGSFVCEKMGSGASLAATGTGNENGSAVY
jgi:hypothetical protein